MAHVHGAKAVKAVTETTGAGAAKTMGAAMAGMGKMNHSGMEGMGKMSEAMTHTMMGVAGKSTLKKILTHPITLIGFGFALGYLAYKYRKDIISERHEE